MDHSNTSNAQGAVQGVLDRVRDTATSQLTTQKNRATDGLGNIAEAVRQSAGPLRERNQETIAEYVEKAADGIDRVSTQLRGRDVEELTSDARQYARRRPALFIGAAFATGLVGARFLKSSAGGR